MPVKKEELSLLDLKEERKVGDSLFKRNVLVKEEVQEPATQL
jgi:hypothetical protein